MIKQLIIGGVIAVALLFLLACASSAMYVVDERDYGLQTRFGEVRAIRYEPGLYVKAPLIDSVQRIDKRTLRADIPPRQVPDRDKERLIIDTVIRYRITDPLEFRKTLRNEETARQRLEQIMYSAIRDTVALHDRTEVIGARPMTDQQGQPVFDEEGLPVYESLLETRDAIGQDIQDRVANAVSGQGYGIEIIAADIKRADFPPQVEQSIIDRLRAERQRVAAAWRADGEEEYRKRTAAIRAEAAILLAEADRDARRIRGEGDAEAIKIVTEALLEDPEFYVFLRTLESYENSIAEGAVLILDSASPDSWLSLLAGPRNSQTGKTIRQRTGPGGRPDQDGRGQKDGTAQPKQK